MDEAVQLDWPGTMARLASPVAPLTPAPLEGTLLVLGLLAVVGLVMMLTAVVRGVGMDPPVWVAFLLAAPLVAHESAILYSPRPNVTVAMNFAGFALPVIVGAWFLVTRRAPVLATALAVTVSAVVCYYSSTAIPHEGVLLHYRIPALVAGGLGALLAAGSWERAGPIAFTAGAGGVIMGADFLRISELMTPTGSHRIILGGAGVADGIFIVAVLSVIVAAFMRTITMSLQRLRPTDARRDAGADTPTSPSASGDGARS